ncbi:methyltransferase domain-containing protein [Thiomicrospira sp. R3]|uniref:methyltransferase domain-containing protein n=1 Tax=Thiomicrospira sp. R3 TaxID=3035472 RepID=UPI00259AEE05|nr:methyltransferase domain-containing protein [Thiomicrospira sp. R3]WFE68702.1 methyltransferase domain-containing protein [Thiomicrospira sp. R3]
MQPNLVWVDLRDKASYLKAHLPYSINLNWPYLQSCLNALPDRTQPLGLIAPSDSLQAAAKYLLEKDYRVAEMKTPDYLLQPGLVIRSGENRFKAWRPNSLLIEQLSYLQPKFKHALDLGCGGGRDAIYLAQQGWQVSAIDEQQRVLNCATALAELHHVKVDWLKKDLRKPASLPKESFDLIMMIRFLDRDLFEFMRKHCRSDGYVLIQTFVQGVDAFGSPKNPNYILRFGELAKEFSEFDVIVDKIESLNDGRPVASFLARRK